MLKGRELEELFMEVALMRGNTLTDVRTDKDYQSTKVDFLMKGWGEIDIKNDRHFGSTGNLLLEWEYLFLSSRTIHKCWGHPECQHHARWFAFFKTKTSEFWFYNAQQYLTGFWKALEDEKVKVGVEHSDDRKSTIYFLFPEKYCKPIQVADVSEEIAQIRQHEQAAIR